MFSTEHLLLDILTATAFPLNVVVTATEGEARQLEKTLLSLGRGTLGSYDIVRMPGFFQSGLFRFESAKRSIAERIKASWALARQRPKVLVCSSIGLARLCPDPQWLKNQAHSLIAEEELDLETLITELDVKAYQQVDRVEEVGEWCVRGSIVDVWSPQETLPLRLEFQGDMLWKIRRFRPHDQRSFETLTQCVLLPAREFTWPQSKETMDYALERLNHTLLSKQVHGESRTHLMEDLRERVPFPGIDDLFYTFTSEKSFSLYQWLQKNEQGHVVFYAFSPIEDIEKTLTQGADLYDRAATTAQQKNELAPNGEIILPQLSKLKEALRSTAVYFKNYTPVLPMPDILQDALQRLEHETLSAKIQGLLELQKNSSAHTENIMQKILVLCENENSALETVGLLAKYLPLEMPREPLSFHPASLGANWYICLQPHVTGYYAPPFLALTEHWFKKRSGETKRSDAPSALDVETPSNVAVSLKISQTFLASQFAEFNEGDFVVHVQHGIAQFRGLVTVTVMDATGDFLLLEYANQDKIYVPIQKMNQVHKYIGSSNEVKLDSLKSTQWEKKRAKAKEDSEKIARELMEHQAKRALAPGHAFSNLDEEYLAFEDAFPYEETEDQHRAIREIMADMSKPQAMDRLLCGDVGFGKTEVAMRAAYRCVLDGKQVAWLVPTTVLAHQHFRSLKERFSDFGVNIALFDRSVNEKSTHLLEQIKAGELDVLVGTHRLLSQNLAFRDLGLLIVDEEQRFGVIQKEKIKQMSYGIDVLTMTATPIPRTLQMAMVGLRGMSLLTTPPKARLATKTFVCPFEDDLIREALEFELKRGGQIFYVHNRVEELSSVLEYLQGLVPKARICIGHGKMTQAELEKTIIAFLEGKSDILLCTTIIESGIDMPNVNTILVQNANAFGLAQLYQLRGRVGRRSTRGYAYFLVNPDVQKNDDGLKRLEILKEHQELGSGFMIASHDLEMRGAGNLLDDSQSGHVTHIGLEAYLQMLDEAIQRLGGVVAPPVTEVEIQVPFVYKIPEDYILKPKERLRTYRRFFGANTEDLLSQLLLECEDRFGPIPQEVTLLGEVVRFRRWLLAFGGVSLIVADELTEIRLSPKVLQPKDNQFSSETLIRRILDVCNRSPQGLLRLTPQGRMFVKLKKQDFSRDLAASLSILKGVLSRLAEG